MSYQPKTGCEGTGWIIDFAAIRARRVPPDKQAFIADLLANTAELNKEECD